MYVGARHDMRVWSGYHREDAGECVTERTGTGRYLYAPDSTRSDGSSTSFEFHPSLADRETAYPFHFQLLVFVSNSVLTSPFPFVQ